jgi:DNA helicase HerA-like ATPase
MSEHIPESPEAVTGREQTILGRVPRVGTDFDPKDIVVGQVISEGDSPNFHEVQFRILAGRHTSIGRVLGIRGTRPTGEHIITLIRVENVREHNPHEDALGSTVSDVIPFETRYAPEGQSTVIYRAAVGEPLEEVILKPDKTVDRIDAVETLPLSGSPVIEVDPALVALALNFADSPDDGYEVGTLHGVPGVRAILRKDVVQTHMFFAGGIGRGKSYARGVMAEELVAHGVPQVNIDPMGEMIEATKALGGMNVVPGKGFTMPLSALEAEDVLDAIPGINPTTNIAVLIAYAHNSLLHQYTYRNGQHFGVAELVQRIRDVAPDLEMHKNATLLPAVQRATSLDRIDYIGTPFDWGAALKPGAIVNIDARGRSVGDLRLMAASVARDIQRLARAQAIPFVVLSIDEAHLIAPNDDKVVTTQVLREIARIGRHYRIGLILTTQSPADMDRAILKRLLTRFVFAIEPDQLESLKGVFSDAPEAIIRQLPKLRVGTCVVTGVSETVKHASVVDVRARKTPIGGQTPDIFADFATRGWPARRSLDEIVKTRKE